MDEAAVKAKCIDFLLSRRLEAQDPEYAIINELQFGDGKRRADLVELNITLNAFEIKSDVDTLNRLPSQVEDYLETFDKLTVVTTQKHLSNVKKICPIGVGILVVKQCGNVFEIRKPKSYSRFKKYYLASLLQRSDLNRLLQSKNISNANKLLQQERLQLISKIESVDVIKREVQKSLIKKYHPRFEIFIKFRGDFTTKDDLQNFIPKLYLNVMPEYANVY